MWVSVGCLRKQPSISERVAPGRVPLSEQGELAVAEQGSGGNSYGPSGVDQPPHLRRVLRFRDYAHHPRAGALVGATPDQHRARQPIRMLTAHTRPTT